MKLLHVIDRLVIGGAEQLLKNTVEGIAQFYPEVEQHVVTTYDTVGYAHENGNYISEIEQYAKVSSLSSEPKKSLAAVRKLRKYIKDHEIEVVHSHMLDSNLVSRQAAKKQVLVATYHSLYHDKRSTAYSPIRTIGDKLTYRKRDHVIFVSRLIQDATLEAIPRMKNNSSVVPNFCHPRFQPAYEFKSSGPLKLIAVGSLRAAKNYPLAFETMGQLADQNISLDVYGDGVDRPTLEKMLEKMNASVTLKGNHEITSELFAQYDALLMTSLHEGMPVSVIEAMTSGIPVILNDVPELREVSGNLGIYYKTNSAQDLQRILTNLASDKTPLQKQSAEVIEYAKKYHISNYLGRLMELYKS